MLENHHSIGKKIITQKGNITQFVLPFVPFVHLAYIWLFSGNSPVLISKQCTVNWNCSKLCSSENWGESVCPRFQLFTSVLCNFEFWCQLTAGLLLSWRKTQGCYCIISIAGLVCFWLDDLQGVHSFGIAHAEDQFSNKSSDLRVLCVIYLVGWLGAVQGPGLGS